MLPAVTPAATASWKKSRRSQAGRLAGMSCSNSPPYRLTHARALGRQRDGRRSLAANRILVLQQIDHPASAQRLTHLFGKLEFRRRSTEVQQDEQRAIGVGRRPQVGQDRWCRGNIDEPKVG